jgi:hypothetical protein
MKTLGFVTWRLCKIRRKLLAEILLAELYCASKGLYQRDWAVKLKGQSTFRQHSPPGEVLTAELALSTTVPGRECAICLRVFPFTIKNLCVGLEAWVLYFRAKPIPTNARAEHPYRPRSCHRIASPF